MEIMVHASGVTRPAQSVDDHLWIGRAFLMHRNTFPTHEIARIGVNSGGGETTDLARTDVLDIEHREGKDDKVSFNHSKAVDAILQKLPVALGVDDKLYYWHGDLWKGDAEDVLHNKIHALAGKLYNRYGQTEVIAALRHILAFSRIEFDANPYLLAVKNGVIDLQTGVFGDCKKEDFISSQIPVSYDPAATCPRYIKYLEEICPDPTDRLMLIDWMAAHAVRLSFPYIMFLLGLGRNGKGVYEDLLRKFYGEDNFSDMDLEDTKKVILPKDL